MSDVAKSVCDDDVYNLMQKERDDECLCLRRDVPPKDISNDGIQKENPSKKNEILSGGNDQEAIKLPSVNTDHMKDSETPDRKNKMKQNDRLTKTALKRSPYAVNQTKAKRSTTRKKKKIARRI